MLLFPSLNWSLRFNYANSPPCFLLYEIGLLILPLCYQSKAGMEFAMENTGMGVTESQT